MKTLTIAAAFLAGGVALGATSGVVAAELITGQDIKNKSITGKDIKPDSVPANRIKAKPTRVRHGTSAGGTVTALTSDWQPGPIVDNFSFGVENPAGVLAMQFNVNISSVLGTCEIQLRLNGKDDHGTTGGATSGGRALVQEGTEMASVSAFFKPKTGQNVLRVFVRGTATSCEIGADGIPVQSSMVLMETVTLTTE